MENIENLDETFKNLEWVPIYMSVGKYVRNEYWRCGELVKMSIFSAKKDTTYNVYLNYSDFEKIRHVVWTTIKHDHHPPHLVYVHSKLGYIHRIIMDPPADMVVDHININPLDNRRVNLRICTKAENNRNISMRRNNTSGIMGVTYDSTKTTLKKWVGQKYYNGKYYRKAFLTKEEAIAHRKYLDETYK